MNVTSPPDTPMLSEARIDALRRALVSEAAHGARHHRRWRLTPAIALAAAATAMAALLITPWPSNSGVVDRALAAVGTNPVLHVAIVDSSAQGSSLVDLRTAEAIERNLRTDIWFDAERGLKRTTVRIDGALLNEYLETKKAAFSSGGPLYTCSWIRAHPTEAAEAGVSCSGDTSPDGPMVDPSLRDFVDQYRTALGSGSARQAGHETIAGQDVVWIEYQTDPQVNRVAVDAATYRPVLIDRGEGKSPLRVLTAETLERHGGFFQRPEPRPVPTQTRLGSEDVIELTDVSRLLGDKALWLGTTWRGLTLSAITKQQFVVSSAAQHESQVVDVVKFSYAVPSNNGASGRSRTIDVYQSSGCVIRLGWTCSARDADDRHELGLPVGRDGPVAVHYREGTFVSIWGATDGSWSALDVARGLHPLGG